LVAPGSMSGPRCARVWGLCLRAAPAGSRSMSPGFSQSPSSQTALLCCSSMRFHCQLQQPHRPSEVLGASAVAFVRWPMWCRGIYP
jgi:hypothetical protein